MMADVVIVVAALAVFGVLSLAMARGDRAAAPTPRPTPAPVRRPAMALTRAVSQDDPDHWDDPENRPTNTLPWNDPYREGEAA